MTPGKQVLRKVVSKVLVRIGNSVRAGSWLVTLECGHTLRQKRSKEVPERKNCEYCLQAQRRAVGVRE